MLCWCDIHVQNDAFARANTACARFWRIRDAVHEVTVLVNDQIVRVEVLNPVSRITPEAVAFDGADIFVRVRLDDEVIIVEQRVVVADI